MILRRMGNKSKIAHKIQQHFPKHDIYIEPFFGAGGMFFNKPKAKCNILNDLDSDVFNLFDVIVRNKIDLIEVVSKMPLHNDLLKFWIENKEEDKILKAARFLFLSNYTFLGSGTGLVFSSRKPTKILRDDLNNTNDILIDCQFNNDDFRKFIKNISLSEENNLKTAFIYNDPPYLGTSDNYSNSFKEQDSIDLFAANIESGCKFAMSEFDHPFILEQAESNNLNIITVGARRNIRNIRTEILVTNYETHPTLF